MYVHLISRTGEILSMVDDDREVLSLTKYFLKGV